MNSIFPMRFGRPEVEEHVEQTVYNDLLPEVPCNLLAGEAPGIFGIFP